MKTKDENDKYEKELVESVLKDFEERQAERKTFESNWQLNINFFFGKSIFVYISSWRFDGKWQTIFLARKRSI